jgi:anti-sigma regulatory factor (Ser/Thr protein kinase)
LPQFEFPNSASLHTARHFLESNFFFSRRGKTAVLRFHPQWSHMEPFALAMAAAWGVWCARNGYTVRAENLGHRPSLYAFRMKLFDHIPVDFSPEIQEHEEAGRFVPVTRIADAASLRSVIGDVSALLHLDRDPDTLAAVQYCVSELLRNVLEHSGAEDGAFVCAHNFVNREPRRVSIAVADCGQGIRQHLGAVHAAAGRSDRDALKLALRPGVTGARPGMYGTPDNAGAGLFITRSIAKGSGGYFLVVSGGAGYRLRRANTPEQQSILMEDPELERHDLWTFPHEWQGTVVALEIRTDHIGDFEGYFDWIGKHVRRRPPAREIRFT